MIVTAKIKMDLQKNEVVPRIDAVQGDTNTRAVELALYVNGVAWTIPEGVVAQVRYRKSNGAGGVYDSLADGTKAWAISGNAVQLMLAPQMLNVPGAVSMQVELLAGSNSLATFPIQLDVEADVSAGKVQREDYVNMRAWAVDEMNQALQTAMESEVFVPRLEVGSVRTLVPGSKADVSITGTGSKPLLNFGIPAGYTPQKGVDYWTEEEQTEMQSVVKEALRPELVSRLQQQPVFADNFDECTDTNLLYLLPDGYLYTYREVTENIQKGTNCVPTSEELASSAIYNGIGYKDGCYISSGSGNDGAKAGHSTTGMIAYPVKAATEPPTIYLRGGSPDRIAYYLSDKSFRLVITQVSTELLTFEQLDTDYWKITPVMLESGNSSLYQNQGSGGYLRFDCICESGADLKISLDEEITEITQQVHKWVNTGHAFVPADYEDRILALERNSLHQQARVAKLEEGLAGAPAYVKEEASRVADLILEKRNAQCLCFAALSDIHYPYNDAADNADTEQALLHAGMGIAWIRKYVSLNFMGLFGDYVRGAGDSTVAESKTALKFIRGALQEAGIGLRQIWMQGNHDRNPYTSDDGDLTDDELYAYIFANTTDSVVDSENVQRGYGYLDFEAQKIRVIYLNSSDISGCQTPDDHMWSAAQLRWLVSSALDFSKKQIPEEWGVVILSHQPMNWGEVPAFSIIDGYAAGIRGTATATEGEKISFDFTHGARAEVICCVNGHTHNFRYSQIGQNGIWQIAVPQVCAGRYNEYGTSWPEVGGELDEAGNPVYYYKSADCARDTSFCVFLIDRKNRKIHALHYGAGIDREMLY